TEASVSLRSAAVEGAAASVPVKVTNAVKLRPEGFFEATWPSSQSVPPSPGSYKIQGRTHFGDSFEIFDTYSFPVFLSEFDLYLMCVGGHYDTYVKMCSHSVTLVSVC